MKNKENVYITSDLGLIAALITVGHSVEQVDRQDPRRVRFHFLSSPKLESDINKYYNGILTVAAQHYFSNLKMAKNRIYQEGV